MKLKDILACSMDSLFTRKWTNLAIIICMVITLDLVFSSAVMYNNTTFYEKRLYSTIKADTDNLVNVSVESGSLLDEEYIEKISTYIEQLKEISGVKYAGAYYCSMCTFEETFYNEEYADINKQCTDELALINYPQRSIVLNSDFELFEMYDIKYDKSAYEAAVSEGCIPVVVGNAYQDLFEVGDKLTFREDTYKIINILDKPVRWMNETYGIAVSSDNTINLDYYFIIPREYGFMGSAYMHSIYFYVDEQTSVKTVCNLATAIALESDIHVSMKTVSESFEEIKESRDESAELTSYMYIAMILVSIISASTANIVSVLFRKKEIGILIANGVSNNEVFKITFFETLVKVLISCAIVMIMSVNSYKDTIGPNFQEILFDSAVVVWMLGVIILVISTIFPAIYIHGKKPREFLEECL